MKLAIGCMATYCVVFFLTFGYIWNSAAYALGESFDHDRHTTAAAVVGSLFWPIYWGGQLGILVTRGARPL